LAHALAAMSASESTMRDGDGEIDIDPERGSFRDESPRGAATRVAHARVAH